MECGEPLVNKQSKPTTAPDRPLVTAAAAMVVLAGMVLFTVRPPGDTEPVSADGVTHSAEPASTHLPASGEPDGLTVVDASALTGLEEAEITHEGVPTAVSYPVVPNAEPLSSFLEEELGARVRAFEAANPGASSYEAEWNVTAAAEGLLGIRVTSVETDSEGPREGYTTYWYDTETGQTHGSQSLLADQGALEALNGLVGEQLSGDADPGSVLPVAALYDSVGFNPGGDLVVEFDAGQVGQGGERVSAVVDRAEAEPLLSELGLRARKAATVGVAEFSVPEAPEAPSEASGGPVPGVLPPVDPSVDCSAPEVRCVALTYDDGPGGRTPELLDMLAEHDARATFFLTGVPVMEHPGTVRRAYAEGHELANHTLGHPDLAGLSAEGVRAELETVQALVYRETGYTMDLMRPPYGSTNGNVAAVTEEMGLAQILWNLDTNDWRDRDASLVADRAVEAGHGTIVLMHDIHSSTVDASREIIRELDSRGYTMVTVSQLLGTTVPGQVYTDGIPDAPSAEAEEAPEV
ncbi:polysaccharide deacetylase family protein [Nocardiopsis algeriensis]|uniref:polysaccharide deacetylase family protein n=1 Tax=Nocardiopsis algeriensis TaxID=1478215 RepID=UPI003B43223E